MEGSTMVVVRDCPPRKLRSKRGREDFGVTYSPTLYLRDNNYGCPYNLRPSDHSGDICLHSGDGDSKRYAEEVVRKNPDLELVAAGPLAVGYGVKDRIVHMNFKAKCNGNPVVETYFAELTITNRDVVIVNFVAYLGPSDSLPEIADTGPCLYCCSRNDIHQPDYSLYPIRCGGEQHLATLTYQVRQLSSFIARGGERQDSFSPRFSHPGVKYISKDARWKRNLIPFTQFDGWHGLREHANLALSVFNGLEGNNFVLVKVGHYALEKFAGIGGVNHFNFEAVNKDDPDAQVQTFFAEVISTTKFLFADLCKCLGPSAFLPAGKVDPHRCGICRHTDTHHPPGPGYLTGREYGASW